MKAKLHFLSYERRKPIKRFILQCQPWNEGNTTFAGYDVSDLLFEALDDDRERGYQHMKGACFGNEVARALRAGQDHIKVNKAWFLSQKRRDAEFDGFVNSHLQNAKSLPDFLESIKEMKRRQGGKITTVSDLSDIDCLDFRPMIGYKGTWKNLRAEHVNIIQTWDYGTFFKS